MNEQTRTIVEVLFERYISDTSQMPRWFEKRAALGQSNGKARVVADYIAGMTDRFAIAEHDRLN